MRAKAIRNKYPWDRMSLAAANLSNDIRRSQPALTASRIIDGKIRRRLPIDKAPVGSCGAVDGKIEDVVVMQAARRRPCGIGFVEWRRQHEWHPAFGDAAVRA